MNNGTANLLLVTTETLSILRSFLTSALDSEDSWLLNPTWTTTSTVYYDRVARLVETSDPETMSLFHSLISRVRQKYRSFAEHERRVQCVPLTKNTDASVSEALGDVCCVCLTPLSGPNRVVRLRPASGNAETCGHFLHCRCLLRLQPSTVTGRVSCPMCRVDLGRPPVRTWIDMEGATPQF